jgi:hypothetical protein
MGLTGILSLCRLNKVNQIRGVCMTDLGLGFVYAC